VNKLMMGVTGMLALAGALMYTTTKVNAAPVEKITICHADGLAGTVKFSEITVAPPAAELHISLETGTPQAGHELDTPGPCGEKK